MTLKTKKREDRSPPYRFLDAGRRDAVQRDHSKAELQYAAVDSAGFLRINQIDHLDTSCDGFWVMLMGLRPIRIKGLFDTTISLLGIMSAMLMKNDIPFRHMQHLRHRSLTGGH
jgi:thymidine kinase